MKKSVFMSKYIDADQNGEFDGANLLLLAIVFECEVRVRRLRPNLILRSRSCGLGWAADLQRAKPRCVGTVFPAAFWLLGWTGKSLASRLGRMNLIRRLQLTHRGHYVPTPCCSGAAKRFTPPPGKYATRYS